MRTTLLDHVVCPTCRSELAVGRGDPCAEVLADGTLICTSGHAFPIVRGVPDFVGGALERVARRTARSFGDQWHRFRKDHPAHRQQFLDWIAPSAGTSRAR
jgi:uncharacterized protein YbaR (Trm112 family)